MVKKKKLKIKIIYIYTYKQFKIFNLWKVFNCIQKMNNLFIIIEQHCNGYIFELLDFLALVSILTGIFVIITKNPIISILFLICLFLSIASYLMLLGMNFIGLSYLLVYIGAVSILFLFILMLINIRISELQSETSNSLPLALIMGLCFYYIIYDIIPIDMYKNKIINNMINTTNEKLFFVTSSIWDGMLIENSHIISIGNIMYTSYFLWIIITSIILLLAMVGTIIITIRS